MNKNIVKCHCGARAFLRSASVVHGEDAFDKHLYVCSRYPVCDSYVSVHKHSRKPKGTLAGGDLRHKRIQAHRAFDYLWKSGMMNKWQAYKWMQAKFGLSGSQAHIAMFSEYMCDQLIECCRTFQQNRAA